MNWLIMLLIVQDNAISIFWRHCIILKKPILLNLLTQMMSMFVSFWFITCIITEFMSNTNCNIPCIAGCKHITHNTRAALMLQLLVRINTKCDINSGHSQAAILTGHEIWVGLGSSGVSGLCSHFPMWCGFQLLPISYISFTLSSAF